MNEYEILEKLQEAGVVFSVKVPDRGKIVKVEASSFDLIEFASDNNRFYAKCHRVTKETYLSWVADEYSVRCAHVEAGAQCENCVSGGRLVSARKYVELQGMKCSLHQTSTQ